MRRGQWIHATIGVAVLAVASAWLNLPRLAPGAFNWAEPGNIAAAIAEGRGFSDPFGGGTGPTAWMPPVFPALVAFVFKLAGVKTATAAAILVVLTTLGLATAHGLLIDLLNTQTTAVRMTASVAFLGLIAVLPGGFLDVLSEGWLSVLLTTLFIWGVVQHRTAPHSRATAALLVAAALGPLTHAALASGMAVVLAAIWFLDWRDRRPLVTSAAVLAVMVATIGGWTVRNRVVLGQWVPIKSNFWYELHLSTVVSTDGLVRSDEVVPRHPFFSTEEFARYAALGEIAYVESFRAPTLAQITAEPADYVRRVGRRVSNAFVMLSTDETIGFTRQRFPDGDRIKLANAGLMLLPPPEIGSQWLGLETAPAAVLSRMQSLQLEQGATAFRDWLKQREAAAVRRTAWRPRLGRWLLSGLPILALTLAFVVGRGRAAAVVGWSLLLHGATVAPLLLINHGPRQQFPQTPLHAVFFAAVPMAVTQRRRAASL